MKKISVSILGATGAVGQRFVELLFDHPWFEIRHLCASANSAGKAYKDTVSWKVSASIPGSIANLVVENCVPNSDTQVAFSALDSSVAGEIEERFANGGHIVISNSKNHRMDPDVPLLIPEINPDHLNLIKEQKGRFKNSKGFIVTNPNCSTIGLSIVLKPLDDAFGVKQVLVTTMQALSGAGYPGVASLDALDNVVPFIGDEEEKMETEPLKILGKVVKGKIKYPNIKISAQCNRVSVRDGHLESVELSFYKTPIPAQVAKVLAEFIGQPQRLNLPSAPSRPIIVREEIDRPQPILDREVNRGMSVTVGRIRKSKVLDIKLTLLVHNTIRGAAGAAILNAELLKAKSLVK